MVSNDLWLFSMCAICCSLFDRDVTFIHLVVHTSILSLSHPVVHRVRRRIMGRDRRTSVIIAEPQNARKIGGPSSFLLVHNSIYS